MRRPEITGFVSIAPPASMYDFAFLAPCPASGLIVHGTKDNVVPEARCAEAGRPADRPEGHQDHAYIGFDCTATACMSAAWCRS
jgi:alpha/beta superfamily hydrolase